MRKSHISIVLFSISILFFTGCTFRQKYKDIKEINYYGFNNPLDVDDAQFISIEKIDKVTNLFFKLEKAQWYLPKGRSRYYKVKVSNNRVIYLEVIAGKPHPVRIIKNDIFTDDWYIFSDETDIEEWSKLLNELDARLNNL